MEADGMYILTFQKQMEALLWILIIYSTHPAPFQNLQRVCSHHDKINSLLA
jgi:hypothetical protein